MKKLCLILFLILILAGLNQSMAQNKSVFKAGISYSKLRTTDVNWDTGLVLGFGREWSVFNNKKVKLVGEILYIVKSSVLKNIIIKPYDYYVGAELYHVDLLYSVGFIEIPVLVKSYLRIDQISSPFLLFDGILSVPIKEFTDLKNRRFFRYSQKTDAFNYFQHPEQDLLASTHFCFCLGLGVKFSKLSVAGRYHVSLDKIETVGSLRIRSFIV